MSKYVVIKGHNNVSVNGDLRYVIIDFIMLDPNKNQEQQMRKYVYRHFFEVENIHPRKLKSEIFKNKRVFFDINEKDFSGEVCTFEHLYNRFWLSFIPLEKLVNFDYKKQFTDEE